MTACCTHVLIGFIIALADCFFRLNELHFALSDFQQALEMDSSDWSVRCRLSIVYNEFGILEYYDRHYLEAIDHLTTCIRYNPRIGAYYLSRARARYMIEVCMCVSCRIACKSFLVRNTLKFHANSIPLISLRRLLLLTPEEFERATLFLQLGLPSTLIRHENGTFPNRSSNCRNL